jgi:hypothetical protein
MKIVQATAFAALLTGSIAAYAQDLSSINASEFRVYASAGASQQPNNSFVNPNGVKGYEGVKPAIGI